MALHIDPLEFVSIDLLVTEGFDKHDHTIPREVMKELRIVNKGVFIMDLPWACTVVPVCFMQLLLLL